MFRTSVATLVPKADGDEGFAALFEAELENILDEEAGGVEDDDEVCGAQGEVEAPESPQVAIVERAEEPEPDGKGKHDFDFQMQEMMRAWQWPPFLFTWKKIGLGKPYGAIQASCPFHRLSVRTGCKKTMNLASADRESALATIWRLWDCCNRAPQFNRQRFHVLPPRLNPCRHSVH